MPESSTAPFAGLASSEVVAEFNLAVPMADGVRLATDVFRPSAPGRYPVILVRTPYDKYVTAAQMGGGATDPMWAARSGYAVVVQSVRGTAGSEGTFRPLHQETDDGIDAIAWAASQEWSNGSVVMAGASYYAATQLLPATRRPPALKGILPVFTAADYYEDWTYQGGAFLLGTKLMWAAAMAYAELQQRVARGEDVGEEQEALLAVLSDLPAAFAKLPLVELPGQIPSMSSYGEALAHPDRDEYWRELAINERYDAIDVPAVHTAGWNDIFLKGTLENYVGLRAGAATEHARANQRLIVSPWGHGVPASEIVGDIWFGPAGGPVASANILTWHRDFIETVLRGDGSLDSPPVQIFVMGANQWRAENEWPLARAQYARFYLRSGGRLTRESPAAESPSNFIYDPADPVPTVSGNTLLPGAGRVMGPRDRRGIRERPDVMLYTSEVLQGDLEVTGPLTATLHVATSARDTDFTAALVDIYPDDRAIGIADGILRLRYRNGSAEQQLATPGEIYEIEIDLAATSNVFKAGHRIGVEISSSNFPRFDRNPNHGGVMAEATESDFIAAEQLIFHDADHASYITLPIIR
jgi:putative CocE/NonD family hydrolase